MSSDEKGLISIEAAISFSLFLAAFILVNELLLSSLLESRTKRVLNSMAMETAALVQIGDKLSVNEYIGHKPRDFKDSLEDLLDGDLSLEELLLEDLMELLKSSSFQVFLTSLFDLHIKEDDFLRSKLDGNLDFSESRILDSGSSIELVLDYEIDLGEKLPFPMTRKVRQKALVDSFLDQVDQELDYDSIWMQSNFVRGKYFAAYLRENYGDYVFKPGQGIDFLTGGVLDQAHSLNIFDRSYSSCEDGKLVLKEENIVKLLKKYARKMEENYDKAKGEFVLLNGEKIKVKNKKLRLLVVLPEEAREIEGLADLFSRLDFDIKTLYLEKVYK